VVIRLRRREPATRRKTFEYMKKPVSFQDPNIASGRSSNKKVHV
jgi:hypothetical protein